MTTWKCHCEEFLDRVYPVSEGPPVKPWEGLRRTIDGAFLPSHAGLESPAYPC